MQAPENHHPGEVRVTAGAGAALIFNGHLWHGGTRNGSREPRRVLQCQLVARGSMRPRDDPAVPPEGLSPAALRILGR